MKTFSELIQGRQNNLDFLRFVAATLVIYSHAYPLTGNDLLEPINQITNGQTTLGAIAVYCFFVISGFLITQSFLYSRSIGSFIKARVLRIFPGLILVTLFTVLIVGPLITSESLIKYFSNSQTYFYFTKITTFVPDLPLPGVFDSNIYQNAVNGSLWTLKYEIICYAMIGFLGGFGLLKKQVIITLFLINTFISIIPVNLGKTLTDLNILSLYFLSGSVFYFYRDKIKHSYIYLLLSLLVTILIISLGWLKPFFPLLCSYFIFYFAYSAKIRLYNFSKFGDFTYGIYIFAFPIQQIIVHVFNNNISPIENFLLSLPFVFLCSIVSWYLVERPALLLKNKNIKRIVSQKVS
ncbi:acyltransferase family protein [Metabacillus bambusae]|uniref:acyltransferase family protein n=1 Tax=Metabacillus bambusae TaxID=2795218 RepID=UPI001A9CC21A|nr:acyltransferase [Metabacillus bambusae]